MEVRLIAGYVSASDVIYVNTSPSKNVPWMLTLDIKSKIYFEYTAIEFLERVKEAVLSLPAKINLPKKTYIGFPRYYMIKLYSIDEIIIEDIVGVKHDGAPTKWGYRFGYWHPVCQFDIVWAIDTYLKYLKAQAQQTQTQTQAQP